MARFNNLPVEPQMFINVDVTELFLEDPDIFTGFALSAPEETNGQVKFKEQRDPGGKTTRLVVQCKI